MASENCPHAVRKRGDVSIHCKKLEGERYTQCAHQYFCGQTKRWEASPNAADCLLRGRK